MGKHTDTTRPVDQAPHPTRLQLYRRITMGAGPAHATPLVAEIDRQLHYPTD